MWNRVPAAVLRELARAGRLDTRELFLDATFAGDRRGSCSGRTGCGVGVKVAVVIDRTGMPVGVATDAANVPGTVAGPAAVACIPAGVRLRGRPLVADRASDADPLRAYFADCGFVLIAPHRRYRRRWPVERTFAWLHS